VAGHPAPAVVLFLGRIFATVAVSTLAGAATVAAGILLYGTHLTIAAALSTLFVFVLGAFAWAATATAVTAAIPTVEAAAPTMLLIYFPVVIISGALGSLSEPHWLTTLANYLPAQPLVHAAGIALAYPTGHGWVPAHDIVVLAVWAIVGMTVALATFRWEPHQPTQRRPARISQPLGPAGARPADRLSDDVAPTTTTTPVRFGYVMSSHV
jgi:ABC-2 type transport system permease protein